ncbi:hypothetical protein QBC34DRAFT_374157 [Podospora aff. communis PSN243]|uniref:Uncharacterized protein n=1 Tax=Podospora aff. communis PSN243 TaxID=3040156 RepID=A0AAV9H4E0_9PEZI|nr:hypothetical protein QBC34DRAFT_374157 [Podospora aff. communis PSN243]
MQFTLVALLALPLAAFAAPKSEAQTKAEVVSVAHVAPFFNGYLSSGPGDKTKRQGHNICPYENCLDECIGWSMAAPCNPMDLCDPGLGCALGCAVACA